jgi:preprotein translocase subunit SecG
MSKAKQIVVENELTESVIKSGNDLILVNPTNKLKVYKVIPESPATVNENTVVVSAGSSRIVTVNPNSAESFSVSVFSGENLVGTVEFTNIESQVTSSIVVLTVILAIIFVVLLVVLIVLLTKKPEKDEEFSESYY